MLTLHPEVMAAMESEHLISSLHSEPLSPIEKELLRRWERTLDSIHDTQDLMEIIDGVSEEKLNKLINLQSFEEIHEELESIGDLVSEGTTNEALERLVKLQESFI